MSDTKPWTCVNCDRILDTKPGEPKMFAMRCDDEDWCPRCFVHHRAKLEPGRFFHQGMTASICNGCKTEQVNTGSGHCCHCGHRLTLALPPVPGAMSEPLVKAS